MTMSHSEVMCWDLVQVCILYYGFLTHSHSEPRWDVSLMLFRNDTSILPYSCLLHLRTGPLITVSSHHADEHGPSVSSGAQLKKFKLQLCSLEFSHHLSLIWRCFCPEVFFQFCTFVFVCFCLQSPGSSSPSPPGAESSTRHLLQEDSFESSPSSKEVRVSFLLHIRYSSPILTLAQKMKEIPLLSFFFTNSPGEASRPSPRM